MEKKIRNSSLKVRADGHISASAVSSGNRCGTASREAWHRCASTLNSLVFLSVEGSILNDLLSLSFFSLAMDRRTDGRTDERDGQVTMLRRSITLMKSRKKSEKIVRKKKQRDKKDRKDGAEDRRGRVIAPESKGKKCRRLRN